MKTTLAQVLYWTGSVAALLFLVAGPLALKIVDAQIEYLASPEGQEHLEDAIALKILERYGQDALYDFQDGAATYPTVVNDILIMEIYGLAIVVFIVAVCLGFGLIGYGFSVLFRLKSRLEELS